MMQHFISQINKTINELIKIPKMTPPSTSKVAHIQRLLAGGTITISDIQELGKYQSEADVDPCFLFGTA